MFVRDEHCHVCEKVTSHMNGRCSFCLEKAEIERVREWESKSVDEKLTDIRKRIEKLEQGPTIYS